MEQNKSWEVITTIGKKIRKIWLDISDSQDLNINISDYWLFHHLILKVEII